MKPLTGTPYRRQDGPERTVAGLARYLVRPARTDEEKARAIFRWIAENIAYDTKSYAWGRIPEAGAEDVFRSRSALCGGYAGLFKSLADKAGLEAEIITVSPRALNTKPAGISGETPTMPGMPSAWTDRGN